VRHQASRISSYIPFGPPDEVKIVHVEAEKDQNGRWIESRWEEQAVGLAVGPDKASRGANSDDFHPVQCQGKRGVARVWQRGDRSWCRGCYVMRYGTEPTDQYAIVPRGGKKKTKPAPMSELERLMRSKDSL